MIFYPLLYSMYLSNTYCYQFIQIHVINNHHYIQYINIHIIYIFLHVHAPVHIFILKLFILFLLKIDFVSLLQVDDPLSTCSTHGSLWSQAPRRSSMGVSCLALSLMARRIFSNLTVIQIAVWPKVTLNIRKARDFTKKTDLETLLIYAIKSLWGSWLTWAIQGSWMEQNPSDREIIQNNLFHSKDQK